MSTIDLMKKNYLIIFILSFFIVLYLSTLYPGVGGRVNYGDSAKWQFLWAIGGTPHSTGYPLYLILSKIFGNVLVFLEPATRITMISVFSAIGTLFVLYKVAELFIENKLARILPSILLGITYPFWSQATEAEVYTLNSLFVSLVIYFMIRFHLTKTPKFFLIGMAVYALSFGNHLTMITLLPAILYIIFATDYKLIFNKKIISLTILFLILGASQYLYVLYLSYQGSPYLEYIGRNASIGHWLSYITGGQFKNEIGGNNTFRGSLKFMTELWKDLGWVFIFTSSFYLLYQKYCNERNNKTIIFLTFIGIFEFLNAITYNIGDIIVYYIPIYLILVLLVTKFIDYLQSRIVQNLLIIILMLFSAFFTSKLYQNMHVKENIAYQNIRTYFTLVPAGGLLFLPRKGFYHYNGLEAANYAKYIEFSDKNIRLASTLDRPYKTLFVPTEFVDEIPKKNYKIELFNNPKTLYDFIVDNQDNILIISARDEAQNGLSKNIKIKLKSIGLHLDKLGFRGSYIAVIVRGKVIFEKINNNGSIEVNNEILNNLGIDKLTSAGLNFGNISQIVYHGKDYSINKRGLNIAIIEKDGIVKKYNIDTYKTEAISQLLYKATLKNDEISSL